MVATDMTSEERLKAMADELERFLQKLREFEAAIEALKQTITSPK